MKKTFLCLAAALVFFALPGAMQAADIEAEANRTEGVAPFVVQFNADIWRSSETERRFHDLDYTWDFNDPDSGVWANSGKSKNRAKGPIAAHVFERPGTYNVSLLVKNIDGVVVDTKNFAINVLDPEVFFAGEKTTCISSSAENDFSGCPSGARRILSDDLSADLPSYTIDEHRVLLDRGSTWSITTTPNLPGSDGPVQIGAYGDCVGESGLGVCGNDPQINVGDDAVFFVVKNKQHWTLYNLSFVGENSQGPISGPSFRFHDILFFRLKVRGFSTSIGWSHWNNYPDDNLIENMSVVECDMADSTGMQMYIGSEKLTCMGNIARNSRDTHILRVWQGYRSVISHNLMSGSSVGSNLGRHALKFHGPGPTSALCEVTAGNGCLENRSEFSVVSDNIFGGSGPWPVAIAPQDAGKDERISDVVFENNYMPADYGEFGSFSAVQNSVKICARYVTIRNNIVDLTGGYSGGSGIVVDRRGVEWTPLGFRILNNTIYRRDKIVDSNTLKGILIGSEARDVEVRNNIVSFVADSRNEIMLEDNSGTALTSHNAMINNPYFVNPDDTNSLSRDFSLTSQSVEAIDKGTQVLVYEDYDGNPRQGPFDLGAYNYSSGGEQTVVRSDVNQDSNIDTNDALLILRKSLGLSMSDTAWHFSVSTGDVDCGGVVNTTDSLLTLRYSLGLTMIGTEWCE